jgi:ribose transport system permease protein
VSDAHAVSDARAARRRPFEGLGTQPVLLALIALMEVAFALAEPRIISRGNMLNVMQQASYLVIFTVAQTLVILTRGFDLSLGMTVSAVGVASALVLVGYGEDPAWWVLAAGIAVGLAFDWRLVCSTACSWPRWGSIRSSPHLPA